MRSGKYYLHKLIASIIGGAVLIYLLVAYWPIAVTLLVGYALWFFITHRTKRCQVCNGSLQRSSYHYTINGQKKRVCPHCNQNLRREISKNAVNETLGKNYTNTTSTPQNVGVGRR